MGLRARTIEICVFGTLAARLVAGRIGLAIGGLEFFGHDVHSFKDDQLPLSLAVGFWLFCCAGRVAYRLRNGHAWPLRLRSGSKFEGLPSFWPGRLFRLAFGSFASWIIDNSLVPPQ
jgi:hypothetical protein